MVNTAPRKQPTTELDRTARLIRVYVGVVVATLAALAVLSAVEPDQATSDAWVHAVIVGVFAVLLPLRLRAARRGSRRAVVAVGIIATIVMVVNVVEALLPGLFPMWMRIEMIGIAVLMATLAAQVVAQVARRSRTSGR